MQALASPLPPQPARFPEVRAVAFDLDATLVDIVTLKCAGARAAARVLGRPAEADALLEAAFAAGIDRPDVVAVITEGDDARAATRAQRAWDAAEDAATRAYPGAARTLAVLQAGGYDLALVTDAPRPFAERRLRLAGLAGRFPVVVTGDDTPRGKADVRPFRLAAAALGVRPEEILMVGDNPALDVGTGRRFGCRTALAAYGLQARLTSDAPEHRPDVRIDALPDLLRLLPVRRLHGFQVASGG